MAAETEKTELGFKAPPFSLPDTVTGRMMNLDELASGKATVVMFICNHCPYVRRVLRGIVKLANDYIPKGIAFIAISSNDVENYPDDHPKWMKEMAINQGFQFPYLYDESQEVAKAYHAACTPDFSVFDGELNCVYRGRMDGALPSNEVPADGEDLRKVLDSILEGRPVPRDQKPSIGCSIKWKE